MARGSAGPAPGGGAHARGAPREAGGGGTAARGPRLDGRVRSRHRAWWGVESTI
ncbi:MAG: hypothetical protein M3515_06210 [Actinomycetota bacterium]|nr:hypothetical protein [Actinomycetota bacterium]MDQ3319822.1 hypothetical protein [Actinomycetota bacterium]MDQ3356088.1 hypothetical protein [Actinomycetota bacterium]